MQPLARTFAPASAPAPAPAPHRLPVWLVAVALGKPDPEAPTVVGVAAQAETGPFVQDFTAMGFNVGLLAAPVSSQALGVYQLSYAVVD